MQELLNFPALAHQIYGVDYALEHHYSINAYAMGQGKSLIGILVHLKTELPTVVVAPAYLKYNWEAEFEKFSKRKLNIKLLVGKDAGFKPTSEDIVILNYSIMAKFPEVFSWAKLYLCDESHYLGNPQAKRTKFLFKAITKNKPERVLFLSGSPITGKIPQWYAPLYMMGTNPKGTSGKSLNCSYTKFREKFCNKTMVRIGGGREIVQFTGRKNLPLLRTYLTDKFLRKDPNFKLELPPTFDKEIIINRDKLDKELLKEYENYDKSQQDQVAIASAKASSALSKVLFTSKYVVNILEETGNPVVIYSDHVSPVNELFKILITKYKCCHITGDTPIKLRSDYVKDFQAGKYNFFIATIGAASTGITITEANNLVFNDISWVHEYNEQAKKRIHRIGQEKPCTYHYIYSSKIDKMISKKCKEKKIIGDLTTDYGGNEWKEL